MCRTDKKKYEITVFLTLTDAAISRSLQGRRMATNYHYRGPSRCCSSVFVGAWGTRGDYNVILEKRQPQVYSDYLKRKLRAVQ